jgi:hypothetical protein
MNDAMLCDNDAISVSRMFPTASRERVSQIRLVECCFATFAIAPTVTAARKGRRSREREPTERAQIIVPSLVRQAADVGPRVNGLEAKFPITDLLG